MMEFKRVTPQEATQLVESVQFSPTEKKAMDFAFLMSVTIWAGLADDRLVCIYGVIPPTLMSYQAYLWMYNTELIEENKFAVVRHSQIFMEGLLKEYDTVVGHATIGSSKSIRWLKWLGAQFGPPHGMSVPFRISRYG